MTSAAHGESAVRATAPSQRRLRRNYRPVWRFLVVAALLQGIYGIAFIFRSSVVVEGTRYFCLFDDALISMRYAQHFAAGEGLVWNRGERVEGYTNFAWTLLMSLCHFVPLSPSVRCLVVQLAGIPVLWGCLVATAVLARACRLLPWSAMCAIAMVASYYCLQFFTLLGMETGLLMCLVTAGLCAAVKAIYNRRGCVAVMLWFALALLVRPDVLLLAAYVFLFALVIVQRGRMRLTAGFALVLAVQAGLTLWRHQYYGEWFPNTYYLKATGWPFMDRIGPGIRDACITIATLAAPLALVCSAILPVKRTHLFLLGAFATVLAYQTYIGGDAWPLTRLVIPTISGVFVLAALAIGRLSSGFVHRQAPRKAAALRVGLTACVILAMNALHLDHWTLLSYPQIFENRTNLRLCRALERIADRDATVAVGLAGAVPYFSGRRCYDMLGKCDPHISRLPAIPAYQRSGHNKVDHEYTLSHYQPDIMLHLYDPSSWTLACRYQPIGVTVDGHELALFVRKGSTLIHGGTPLSLGKAVVILDRPDKD